MIDKNVLTISSEVSPYWKQTKISKFSYHIPKVIHENKNNIRIFMPRFGLINERRHQLHEVIRLSGANLVVNDTDMPLIIKVASIPKERMQVYFIYNEDCFKRKYKYLDAKNNPFIDNDERMIFFTKGVIETIKKLNWVPDVIHLHGLIASLFPLYLNSYYKDDPIFTNTKIVTSLYDPEFNATLNDRISSILKFDKIDSTLFQDLLSNTYNSYMKLAIRFSDAVVFSADKKDEEMIDFVKTENKPSIDINSLEECPKCMELYSSIL